MVHIVLAVIALTTISTEFSIGKAVTIPGEDSGPPSHTSLSGSVWQHLQLETL